MVKLERPLTTAHHFFLNVLNDALMSEFALKKIIFLSLRIEWHTLGVNFLLTLFVSSHDLFYECGEQGVLRGKSVMNDLFKLIR